CSRLPDPAGWRVIARAGGVDTGMSDSQGAPVSAANGVLTSLHVDEQIGDVSALLLRPERARWLLVLAHGAGTDMRHRSMAATSAALARARIATLRFNFPSREQRSARPDPPAVATAAVRAAVRTAAALAPQLPLLAGGRSFGGRMTSLAAAQEPLPGVRGLVFLGFPLHPAGRPGTERA